MTSKTKTEVFAERSLRWGTVGLVVVISGFGGYFAATRNINSFPWLIGTAANLYLASFVFLKDKKNILNRTFALMTLCCGIWSLDVFGLHIAPDETFAFNWSKGLRIGMIFLPATTLHFMLTLIQQEKSKVKLVRIAYIISLVFVLLHLSGNFENIFIQIERVYYPRGGMVYKLFILNVAIFLSYGLFQVYKAYRKEKAIRVRNQLRYFFIAATICTLLGFTNALPPFGIKIYPLAGLSTMFFSIILAYTIVKHEFIDIRIIISRGIAYTTLVGVITGIYILTVGIFQGIFGTTRVAQSYFLVNAFAAMIIAATFQPLKNKICLSVDRLFFKERYDPQKILKEFSWAVSSTTDLDALLDSLLATVTKNIHIDKGSIMLLNEQNERFEVREAIGLDKQIIEHIYFETNDFLSKYLREKGKIFIREEYEFRLSRGDSLENEGASLVEVNQTLDKLTKLNATLSIPLKMKDKLIGIFNVGNKMSGEMFIPDDWELLTTIANQAAVAIENARLYEEMLLLEKNLHRADKLAALGTLASSIAHEIKNPLVSIKTFTQLLPHKFNDDEFRNKYNMIVPDEIERLEDILNELLDFSRSKEGTCQLLEIEKILDEILLFMENEISKHHIEVIKEYSQNLPKILGHVDQLKQVFMNIILNALQAMPDGGSLRISTGVNAGNLEIKFVDTGHGIPKENYVNLFKPFFSTKKDGTGLGLTISKQIIKEHNGSIELESEVNKGTTFIIRLPLTV